MFWSAGCSFLRAEGFSCSLCVRYGSGSALNQYGSKPCLLPSQHETKKCLMFDIHSYAAEQRSCEAPEEARTLFSWGGRWRWAPPTLLLPTVWQDLLVQQQSQRSPQVLSRPFFSTSYFFLLLALVLSISSGSSKPFRQGGPDSGYGLNFSTFHCIPVRYGTGYVTGFQRKRTI